MPNDDATTEPHSGLAIAIQDMSFNRWKPGRGEPPAAVYNAQRDFWEEHLKTNEPESVDIFNEHYPPAVPIAAPEAVTPPETKRAAILTEATRIIHGDREKDYGAPIDSFTRLAEALNLVLRPKLREGVELDAVDAAVLMIAMKLSRLAGGDRKDDTWVDLAGYAALGADVRDQL